MKKNSNPTVEAEIVVPALNPKQEQALARRAESGLSTNVLTKQDIDLLTSVGVIPKDTPANVVTFFAKTCASLHLSPFKHQIHLIRRMEGDTPKFTMQTGIDGYRKRADQSGRYAGNDDYRFDDGKTEFEMIESGLMQPETATSTVYKMVGGVRCPFTATVRWKEYVPKSEKGSFMWFKMPFNQLGKCAEALSLRKAFPDEIADLRLDEEMEHLNAADVTPSKAEQGEKLASDDGTGANKPKDEANHVQRPGKAPLKASEKAETERKALLQVFRGRINKQFKGAQGVEAEICRFFQNVPSHSKKWKGQLLLAINGTFETIELTKLEFIVQQCDRWMPLCEEWCVNNPKQP